MKALELVRTRQFGRIVHHHLPTNNVLVPARDGHCFPLGRLSWVDDIMVLILTSPQAATWVFELIERHARGAWSDVGEPSEREQNLHALHFGLAVRSLYEVCGFPVYIMTNASRTRTTISRTEL